MLNYIDTHAHISGKEFASDIEKVRQNYLQSGVNKVIDIASNLSSSRKVAITSSKYSEVYYSVGTHPADAGEVNSEVIKEYSSLIKNDKCLAVGEIGLDYHYEPFDKQVQQNAFTTQIEFSISNNLPFICHSRDSVKDTVDIISYYKNYYKKGFLMHCFAESKEIAKILLDLGGYFAFGGATTFTNYKKQDVIKYIPAGRIFCETDCPYMSPVPYRGTRNEPKNVAIVYQNIANIKGIKLEELVYKIEDNFSRLFDK